MTVIQPHIRCSKDLEVKYAILPGDPKRVDRIAEFLEDVEEVEFNREYKSLVGYYKGIKILAMSTGMGGASTGIAVEELKNIGLEVLIRIGSCGATQNGIRIGDLIIPNGIVRDEGASRAYVEEKYPAVPDTELLFNIIDSAQKKGFPYHVGVTRSHDSFYTDEEENIDNYWSKKRVLGADMESAALFVIGGLRGLKTASILNVVVEFDGNLEEDINGYVDGENGTLDGEKKEILTALEAIYAYSNKN
ncbi:nucleoside phosphorylase [Clostridium drakei]|uniref:Uridine phosphorylase n=1 Tax=Clostridium drakei TaxID=332101 RepID=A0A2U8DS75_9CLOT|nr:nucleoside phosphorylase [Clostridium drakei]AWI05094.1 phosphorylase [Clostridium drakei]